MSKRKIGKENILSYLRKLFASKNVRLWFKKLPDKYGHVQLDIADPPDGMRLGKIVITVDPRKEATIGIVLHELLHCWFIESFGWGYKQEIEEVIVLALEAKLWDYLREPRNAPLLEAWDRAIKRKISHEPS